MDKNDQIQNYIALAVKNEKKFLFLKPNYEDAAMNYAYAANLSASNQNYQNAALYYEKAADDSVLSNNKIQAASYYHKAYNVLKNITPNSNKLIELLTKANKYYLENNMYIQAANCTKNIAEIYETNNDLDKCLATYLEAVEILNASDRQSTYSIEDCKNKIACIYARKGMYNEAIDIFDNLANSSLTNIYGTYMNSLREYKVSELLLNICLCYLAMNNLDDLKNRIKKYKNMYIRFEHSREYTFLNNIIQYFEIGNLDKYDNEINNYFRIKQVDLFKSFIFDKIRNNMLLDNDNNLC